MLKNENSRIFYAGFSDYGLAKAAGKTMEWQIFPATEGGLEQAIEAGFTDRTVFDYNAPIPKENDNSQDIIRYGGIIIDIDCVNSPRKNGNLTGLIQPDIPKALLIAKKMLEVLDKEFGVILNDIQIYASGGKGFHIIIPADIIGSINGEPNLHEIYKDMVQEFINIANKTEYQTGELKPSDFARAVDMNMYNGGRGHLMRLPNIRRPDGNYKVPVTYGEIMDKDANYFIELVKQPRNLQDTPVNEKSCINEKLNELFIAMKSKQKTMAYNLTSSQYELDKLENNCKFMKFCREHAPEVTEPQWHKLASILGNFGCVGEDKFLEYSRLDTLRYNFEETKKKFQNGKKYKYSCKKINEVFDCGQMCGISYPTELVLKDKNIDDTLENFVMLYDGLYYLPEDEDKGSKQKISSLFSVIARARNKHNLAWAVLIDVKDPKGDTHSCLVPFCYLNTRKDDSIEILSDAGLILEECKGAATLLRTYIKASIPEKYASIVVENGWLQNNGEITMKYMPFDSGEQADGSDYLCQVPTPDRPIYEQKGTLEDWQLHIGKECANNPLLQIFAISALAGPLLPLCSINGFGLHLYGNSTTGKTTALEIAKSVNGAQVLTWRGTSNGLEGIAASHNHNTLLLDEITQCDPDTTAQVAYMLANGVGKIRAQKTGKVQAVVGWNLLFLSTGEETMKEHISHSLKSVYKAGQMVRAIDIEADGGIHEGVFTTLPDGQKAGDYSKMLKEKCSQYYGAVLLEFLQIIKKDTKNIIEKVNKIRLDFVNKYISAQLGPQAGRIGEGFAFLAGVGEAAIEHNIFPWEKGEAFKAAVFCFDSWLEKHNYGHDYEITLAYDALISQVHNNFWGKCGEGKAVEEKLYRGQNCYLIPREYIIHYICKERQYHLLCQYLLSKGIVALDKNDNLPVNIMRSNGRDRVSSGILLIKDKALDENCMFVQNPLPWKLVSDTDKIENVF